jgi:hypothetical protein
MPIKPFFRLIFSFISLYSITTARQAEQHTHDTIAFGYLSLPFYLHRMDESPLFVPDIVIPGTTPPHMTTPLHWPHL